MGWEVLIDLATLGFAVVALKRIMFIEDAIERMEQSHRQVEPDPENPELVRMLVDGRYAGWVSKGSEKYELIRQGMLPKTTLDEG